MADAALSLRNIVLQLKPGPKFNQSWTRRGCRTKVSPGSLVKSHLGLMFLGRFRQQIGVDDPCAALEKAYLPLG